MDLSQSTGELTELLMKERIRFVVHLAAQSGIRESVEQPDLYIRDNVNAFVNML